MYLITLSSTWYTCEYIYFSLIIQYAYFALWILLLVFKLFFPLFSQQVFTKHPLYTSHCWAPSGSLCFQEDNAVVSWIIRSEKDKAGEAQSGRGAPNRCIWANPEGGRNCPTHVTFELKSTGVRTKASKTGVVTAREGSGFESERQAMLKVLVFVPKTMIRILNDLVRVIQPVNKDVYNKYWWSKNWNSR